MKRLCGGLLAAVLLLLPAGCVRLPIAPSSPTTAPTAVAEPYHDEYADGWAYATLSADQQRNYAAVYAAVKDGFGVDSTVTVADTQPRAGLSVELPVPLSTEEELSTLYTAVVRDNPAFFHLGSVYGYDGRQYGDDRRFTALKLTYTMTADRRLAARQALEAEAETVLAAVPPSCSPFQAELILHDAITERCRYATAVAEAAEPLKTHPTAFTAYGALVEGEAVCEGYAYAMQYLLSRVGISASVVSGQDNDGQPHMWNALLLDGLLYYTDVTWDDSEPLGTYTYFNLTAAEAALTHTVEDTVVEGRPVATENTQSYYRVTESYLDTLSIEEIAEHLAARFAEGTDTAHVQFSEESFGNALFFVRSTAWFTDTVNAFLPTEQAPLTGYRFTYNETYKTVTICKKTS